MPVNGLEFDNYRQDKAVKDAATLIGAFKCFYQTLVVLLPAIFEQLVKYDSETRIRFTILPRPHQVEKILI